MKRIHWKLWSPLIIGAAVVTLALVHHLGRPPDRPARVDAHRPNVPETQSGKGFRVRRSEPQRVVMPETPPQAQVASAAQKTMLQQSIYRAVIASARRDQRTRVAAVDSLKRERSLSLQMIEEELAKALNPEHIRQLDMLHKEVSRP